MNSARFHPPFRAIVRAMLPESGNFGRAGRVRGVGATRTPPRLAGNFVELPEFAAPAPAMTDCEDRTVEPPPPFAGRFGSAVPPVIQNDELVPSAKRSVTKNGRPVSTRFVWK